MRFRLTWLVVLGVLCAGAARANDFADACEALAHSEVVFVGRAGPSEKRRISNEAEIAPARIAERLALRQLETYMASKERLALDPEVRRTRDHEMAVAYYKANEIVNQLVAMDPGPIDLVVLPMEVETWFLGLTKSQVYVDGTSPVGFEPGGTYLVYGMPMITGYLQPQGKPLYVVPLDMSKDVEQAEGQLDFLRLAAFGGTTIHGTLQVQDPARNHNVFPLGGIAIQLILDGGGVLETFTKNDGRFLVTGVPPGEVRIVPMLPSTLTLPHPVSETVRHGGCIAANMTAVINGRVSGILSTEQNMPYEFLELMLASKTRAYTTQPNDRGEFEFIGVEPGEYVLQTHLSQPIRTKALCESMPPTFYPGTANRDQAEQIVVGKATRHEGVNFVARCEP